MKIPDDIQFKAELKTNAWEQLKQLTDARIALGRVGGSQPTKPSLEFQLAHAQAKDAVLKMLDVQLLTEKLAQLDSEVLHIHSCAEDKDCYLKRPDLGRQLSEHSRALLQQYQQQHPHGYDVLIVAGDGLSARAIEDNAPAFIAQLQQACINEGWSLAPLLIATGSRVALGDEAAQILKAKMLVMLIGERPGLSSPDSMGIYYTWNAYTGCHDAMRNCISNVRPAGLSSQIAIQRLTALMRKSRQLQLSGVQLKDEHEMTVESQGTSHLERLF